MELAVAKRRLAACFMVVAVLLPACTNLEDVTRFASSARSVGESFPDIADAALRSCRRANKFISPKNPLPPLNCGWYEKTNPSLLAVNAALSAYIASLGRLSGGDTSKVGESLDNLSTDLKKSDPSISDENLNRGNAAGGLVKAIAEVWASGYRQRSLTRIIQNNDPAVQAVSQFLSDYAAAAYLQMIEHERGYETSFCLNETSAKEPLASYLLEQTCEADDARLVQQRDAIHAYQQAMATIRETHSKIAAHPELLNAKELNSNFGSSASTLGKAAASIKKAF